MNTNIRILLAVVVLDGMVMGIVIPAMPLLIAGIQETSIRSIVIWGGILTATFGVTQLLFSPYLGALSDMIGRRKVLILALFGMAIEFVILLTTYSIWMLVLARAIAGAASANRAVISAAIADTYAEEDRAGMLGKQTAAFAAGLVFGPTIGSAALVLGTTAPFYLALVLILSNLALTIVLFKETLPVKEEGTFVPSSSLKLIKQMTRLRGTRKGVLLLSYLFYSMAFIVYPALWSYYAQGVLGWSPLKMGLSMTVFCTFLIVANVWGLKYAIAGVGAVRAIKFALAGNVITALLLASSPPDVIAFTLFPIIALISIADPLLLSSYSEMGDRTEQGLLQGQMASMRAMSVIISPPLLGYILATTSDQQGSYDAPGALFIVVGLFYGASLFFYTRSTRQS